MAGTKIQVPSNAVDKTYTWPATDGTNGASLTTDGSGVLSWASGGGSEVFCGSYDFRIDGSSTAQNVLISLPAGTAEADVRAYQINFYGIGISSNVGYYFSMIPYNGNSSILSGNTITYNFRGFFSTNDYLSSKSMTAGMMLNWNGSRPLYSGNSASTPKQNYDNNSGWGGQLTGKSTYINSLKNGAYTVDSAWRSGASDTFQDRSVGIGSASSNNATTNYADGFFFYVSNSSQAAQSVAITEGVVSVTAILG